LVEGDSLTWLVGACYSLLSGWSKVILSPDWSSLPYPLAGRGRGAHTKCWL
jgi:hypothetical protein